MVSIIIPCFNSGRSLIEAVESCFRSLYKNFEVLIIDDGSTERLTLNELNKLKNVDQIQVFHKENGGPASARNLGVIHSKGEFLLFLDSDNQIKRNYISNAIKILSKNSSVGVVYSKPNFFGDEDGIIERFQVKDFNYDAILSGNYIDMCSFVRKEAFLSIGGFDESKDIIGWEDWDFWIRLSQTYWEFEFLDEILFDYRVRKDSLMGSADHKKKERMLLYFGSKHGYHIHKKYRQYFRLMEKIQNNPFSYFFRIVIYKYVLRRPFIK